MMKKRNVVNRKPNFDPHEVDTLLAEIKDNYTIISSKFNELTKHDKCKAWNKIAEAVSCVSLIERDVDDVKKKWCDLKRRTKDRVHEYKEQPNQAAVCSSSIDYIDKRIISIVGDSFFGIEMGKDSEQCSVDSAYNSVDKFEIDYEDKETEKYSQNAINDSVVKVEIIPEDEIENSVDKFEIDYEDKETGKYSQTAINDSVVKVEIIPEDEIGNSLQNATGEDTKTQKSIFNIRKPNFDWREIETLLAEIVKNKYTINRSGFNELTRHEKNKAWSEIAEAVSSVSSVERDVDEVKKKWSDLKRKTKERVHEYVKHRNKVKNSDVVGRTLSVLEERIISILGGPFCGIEMGKAYDEHSAVATNNSAVNFGISNEDKPTENCSRNATNDLSVKFGISRDEKKTQIVTRKPNFETCEVDTLITEIKNNKLIINSKYSEVTKYEKSKAWSKITEAVSSASSIEREVDEVKKKWSDLKRRTKERVNQHQNKTELDEKIISIVGDTFSRVEMSKDSEDNSIEATDDSLFSFGLSYEDTEADNFSKNATDDSVVKFEMSHHDKETDICSQMVTNDSELKVEMCHEETEKYSQTLTNYADDDSSVIEIDDDLPLEQAEPLQKRRRKSGVDAAHQMVKLQSENLVVEKRRLALEITRFNFEKKRLEVEEKRLRIEERRLQIEERRLEMEESRFKINGACIK